MFSLDLAPVDAKGSILRLGDKGDLLAEVELGIRLGVAALDLDEGDFGVLCAEGSLVAENGSVHVQAGCSLAIGRHAAVGDGGCESGVLEECLE